MDNKIMNIKIGAAIMARNAEFFIEAAISSLSWVDGVYLYDDNSIDRTVNIARNAATVFFVVDESKDIDSVFRRGEKNVRNHIIQRAFSLLKCDVLILLDSDELLCSNLKPIIYDVFSDPKIDSLCFSIWHLYSLNKYLHFWETHMNGVYMIDPHIRVIRQNKKFENNFPDGSHPFIRTTDFTRCIHGSYHYHLKYFRESPYPNYALNFLPKYPSAIDVAPYLRRLPAPLPEDIRANIQRIDWNHSSRIDTDYYKSYKRERILLTSDQVNIHPRDIHN